MPSFEVWMLELTFIESETFDSCGVAESLWDLLKDKVLTADFNAFSATIFRQIYQPKQIVIW